MDDLRVLDFRKVRGVASKIINQSPLLTLNSDRKIEPNNSEDLLRELLGKDAYLLFVYDKLIATVSDLNS